MQRTDRERNLLTTSADVSCSGWQPAQTRCACRARGGGESSDDSDFEGSEDDQDVFELDASPGQPKGLANGHPKGQPNGLPNGVPSGLPNGQPNGQPRPQPAQPASEGAGGAGVPADAPFDVLLTCYTMFSGANEVLPSMPASDPGFFRSAAAPAAWRRGFMHDRLTAGLQVDPARPGNPAVLG